MQLPDAQVATLQAASATEQRSIEQLADQTDHPPETITRAAFELADEKLVEIEETTRSLVRVTDEGREYVADGLPETRLLRAADDDTPIGDAISAAGLDGGAVDIAMANFPRKYGAIQQGELRPDPDADPDADPEATLLAELADESGAVTADEHDAETLDRLVSRGLVTRSERTVRSVELTDDGVTALMEGVERAETVDRLTPELLTSGEWENVEFAEYNVEADAPSFEGGREHVLRDVADRVKDVLVGMGFQEMDGPHAEADFWINDALFMPQDHPARTHWDRFAMDVPPAAGDDTEYLPGELVERVERAHREGVGDDGDGYHSPWSETFARAVALRGHTTSFSMRYLSGFADADLDPPQRYFSVQKAYRNDTLDATHLLEFFQIEGWVLADELSVRDLMGTFEEFYQQFGITDIQFKPHYNPYTEPSFELFGEHPETGELIEIGNSGLFRDEVLEPLGVEGDVMAWGLALERLAMLTTGADDIRDLHGTLADLEFLRTAEVTY